MLEHGTAHDWVYLTVLDLYRCFHLGIEKVSDPHVDGERGYSVAFLIGVHVPLEWVDVELPRLMAAEIEAVGCGIDDELHRLAVDECIDHTFTVAVELPINRRR